MAICRGAPSHLRYGMIRKRNWCPTLFHLWFRIRLRSWELSMRYMLGAWTLAGAAAREWEGLGCLDVAATSFLKAFMNQQTPSLQHLYAIRRNQRSIKRKQFPKRF